MKKTLYDLNNYALNKQVFVDYPILINKITDLENELFDWRHYQPISDLWDQIIDTLVVMQIQLDDAKKSIIIDEEFE